MRVRMNETGEIAEVSESYAARLFEQGKCCAFEERVEAEGDEPKQRERAAENKAEPKPYGKGGRRKCR